MKFETNYFFVAKGIRSCFLILITLIAAITIFSQSNEKSVSQTDMAAIRSSPAYSEILLRKTEIQADLEAVIADYTDENPKVIDMRFELNALNKSLEKVNSVKPVETGKLTLALGKLIVKKASLETELSRLLRSYGRDHPEVKRAARRVEIFDSAIREILR